MTKEDEAPQEIAVDIATVSTETNGHLLREKIEVTFHLDLCTEGAHSNSQGLVQAAAVAATWTHA